jgi:hypothetical protein
MTATAKDLTQEAPASPGHRVGGYVILARMDDKCRAMLSGHPGDFHTDCPLDHFLLDFKGVAYDEIKHQIECGATDEEIAEYLDGHGIPKTPEEIKAWSDSTEEMSPYDNPEKKDWFAAECAKLNLDPAKTTLFEWLDADDKASFS